MPTPDVIEDRADRSREIAAEPTLDERAIPDQLREALELGSWPAGTRLKPAELSALYGIKSSAMREHLLRFWGEGLVQLEEQRGFSTLLPTPQSFFEVRHLRVVIEAEGARLSIANGDLEWEADLAAAHHKLAHIEQRLRDGGDRMRLVRLWSRHDRAFHETLIGACGSELLIAEHARIYSRFRLHTAYELQNYGFRHADNVREHGRILAAALARDAEACARALDDHLAIYRHHDPRPTDPFAALAMETS